MEVWLERVLHAEPELHGGAVVDRFGDVEAKRGSLDEAEEGRVQPQADAKGVGDVAADLAAVGIDGTDVIEGREVQVAAAGDVVEHVPADVAGERETHLEVRDPEEAPLPLGEVVAAEESAAAEGVELGLVRRGAFHDYAAGEASF